ncbi:MAG: DUF4367 domain-containing protein [Ruminococcus sp.]|nr:DUF4367 domain-containing protein [Ruminococcus sp.]
MEKILNDNILVQALEIYEESWLSTLTVTEEIAPSKNFEKKMQKLIKSQTNVYHKMTYTRSRKVISVLAAALILLASMMSVGAIREAVLGFFVSHGEEVDYLEYNTDSQTYPQTIETAYVLAFTPESYTLDESYTERDSALRLYVSGDDYLSFGQYTKGSYKSASDSEFSEIRTQSFDGTDYIIRAGEEAIMLVWEKDGYVFELVGFEEESEMLRIAASAAAEGETE